MKEAEQIVQIILADYLIYVGIEKTSPHEQIGVDIVKNPSIHTSKGGLND